MRVRARKHVRNEGSRRFKSVPLRQAVRDVWFSAEKVKNSGQGWLPRIDADLPPPAHKPDYAARPGQAPPLDQTI